MTHRLLYAVLVVLVAVSLCGGVCLDVESVANADYTHRYQPAYQYCIPEGQGDLSELRSVGGANWLASAGRGKVVPLAEKEQGTDHMSDVAGIVRDAKGAITITPNAARLGWKDNAPIRLNANAYEVVTSENSTEVKYLDYVYGSGRDLYTLEDTPQNRITDWATSTVHGISEVRVYADILGQGRTLLQTEGRLVEGSWESYDGLIYSAYSTNPVTGAEWTWQEIDDMQAGIELSNAVCYDVWVRVEARVGSQTFWPVTPVECTPGTVVAWTDVDLDTYIGGLPGGVTGVLLHVVNTGAGYDFGLRKNGSTDARIAGIASLRHIWATIGVDANKIFECYVENKTYIDVYIVGYTTTGVTFNTNAIDKSLAGTGAWTNIDCSVSAPAADGLIFEIYDAGVASAVGLRKDGSADNRTNYTSGYCYFSSIIGCDAGQISEGYIGDTDINFYLTGYITDGATFLTNATDYSLAGTAAWTDLAALPAGADMAFFEVTHTGDNYYGLRKNGVAENLYYIGYRHNWAFIASDTLLVEGKIESTGTDFWLVGYSTTTVTAPDITTNAATNIAATTARLNAYVDDDGGEDCQVRFEYDTDSGAPYTFNTAWVDGYSTGEAPWANIAGLTLNDQYWFRAQIWNSDSVVDGNELDFWTSDVIEEPTELLATGKDSETVVLTWTKGLGASSTNIYRKLGGYPTVPGDGSLAYSGTLNSCLDENLTPGTTYYYAAWSYSGGTPSADFDTDFVTLPLPGSATGDDLPSPSMPSGWFQSPDTTKVENIPGASLITTDLANAMDMPAGTLWVIIGILAMVGVSAFTFVKIQSLLLSLILQAVTVVVLSIMGILPMWMAFVLLAMSGSLSYVMTRA